MELNGSHFPTARLMKRPYQRPYTTHFIPNSLETHWMKDDTTAKPMIPASSRVSADYNRVPESCYPTLKRTVTKTPPSPAPDLPSKPVTTSPRLVTVHYTDTIVLMKKIFKKKYFLKKNFLSLVILC